MTSDFTLVVRNGDQVLLEQLLNAGGNINLQDSNGKTLLHVAIQEGRWEIVDLLLKKRADPKLTNEGEVSCLHFAAAQGDKNGFVKILSLGLDINAVNKNGKTPLHVASEKGHLDVIKVLLMNGASTTIKDGFGRNPAECGRTTAYNLITNHKPGTKYVLVADMPDEEK
eukprot:TRINITY_DN1131_c0_g1_i17.p1 TRINITY_DN1131_c0_g1~~TRINITY_DN1131_c0_g1_i17.p1  ORF type:complete len:169 (+),score=34.84 TRINITY_DN1131_c0_g1_i17:598-1104(+)